MKNEQKGAIGQENKQIFFNPDLKSFVDFSIGLLVGLEKHSVWRININSTNIPKQNNDESVDYLKTFEVIYNNSIFYGFSSHYYNSINGVKIEDKLTKEIDEVKRLQNAEKEKRVREEYENSLKNVAARLLGSVTMRQDFSGKPYIFGDIDPYSTAENLSLEDTNKIIKASIENGYERNISNAIEGSNNETIKKTINSWIKELSPLNK